MFRTLTARAVVPVAMAITGFVVVCCVLLYAAVKEDLTRSAIAQETSLAATVIKSARYTMLKSDREGLRNIVRNVGEGRGVEYVRLLNNKGIIAFSSIEAEVGAPGVAPAREGGGSGARSHGSQRQVTKGGTEILAISLPVFNEPACFSAACHVHDASQKILGTLDIGVSTDTLKHSLAVMRNRMLLFCIMVLLLTIGGVAALLQKNLFAPIRQLTEYSDRAAAGEAREPFTHRCAEIDRLAANLNTLTHKVGEAERELASAQRATAQTRKGADAGH